MEQEPWEKRKKQSGKVEKSTTTISMLNAGNIAEMGTHDTLLAENGIYARLYQTQAQYYA